MVVAGVAAAAAAGAGTGGAARLEVEVGRQQGVEVLINLHHSNTALPAYELAGRSRWVVRRGLEVLPAI